MLTRQVKHHTLKWLCPFLMLVCLPGCEDVVEINVPGEEPRLIVDALFRVDENEPFIPVEVKVSLTDNFFGAVPVTELERIIILIEQIEDGIIVGTGVLDLAETAPGTGIYAAGNGIPISVLQNNEVNYILIINYIDNQS